MTKPIYDKADKMNIRADKKSCDIRLIKVQGFSIKSVRYLIYALPDQNEFIMP